MLQNPGTGIICIYGCNPTFLLMDSGPVHHRVCVGVGHERDLFRRQQHEADRAPRKGLRDRRVLQQRLTPELRASDCVRCAEVSGILELGNVWIFVQLILVLICILNQLNKNPNIV